MALRALWTLGLRTDPTNVLATAAAAAVWDRRLNDVSKSRRAGRASQIFGVDAKRVRERIKLLESLYFERDYLPALNKLSRLLYAPQRALRAFDVLAQGACFFSALGVTLAGRDLTPAEQRRVAQELRLDICTFITNVLQDTDLPAVIASYNGGEEAVRRWLRAYDGRRQFSLQSPQMLQGPSSHAPACAHRK